MRLFEIQKEVKLKKIDRVMQILKANCDSNTLAQIKSAGNFLYHASALQDWNEHTTQFSKNVIVDVTKQRAPAVPHPNAEQKLKQAGFTALRSNSLFCVADYNKLFFSYGQEEASYMYAVFPAVGSSLTWSTYNSDYFSTSDELLADLTPQEFVKQEGMIKNDLFGAIRSGNTVMLTGKFVAVNCGYLPPENLKKLLFKI